MINDAVGISIEQSKDSLEAILGFGLSNLGADDVQELGELNGFILFLKSINQGEDEGVSLVKPQLIENLVDLSGINAATAILIKDIEGLFELIIVLSSETIFPGELRCLFDWGWWWLCFGGSAHLNLNNILINSTDFLNYIVELEAKMHSYCQITNKFN